MICFIIINASYVAFLAYKIQYLIHLSQASLLAHGALQYHIGETTAVCK